MLVKKIWNNFKIKNFIIRQFDTYSISIKYSTSEKLNRSLKELIENSSSFREVNNPDVWLSNSYTKKKSQSEHSIRLKVDPRETSVLLFPGQGSQYVGMCKSILSYPNVKNMFDSASEILRYDLLDLCLNGPEDMLNMTVHSQAAVVVASLAAVEKMREESIQMIENCVATAGFSVGEYSALVFSGSLDFENAIKLLKIRGEAMQAASDMEPSGMMTVFLDPTSKIKLACAAAREWCEKQTIYDPVCTVAIYMFPDCKVIAGHLEALKFIERNAKQFGIKKMKYLPVSGAFHTKLMKPAKVVLKKALQVTAFDNPLIPVHSNINGKPYSSPEQIKKHLAEQLCKPVAWEQTMHIIYDRPVGTDFPDTFECGPGTALKSILRLNHALAHKKCSSIQT